MKEQPECIVGVHGAKEWRLNGYFHREDGPAYESANGHKEWFLHGKYHREDGPAVERASGRKEWWLNGKRAHPETLVDLQLSRGVFCYYDEEADELRFDA